MVGSRTQKRLYLVPKGHTWEVLEVLGELKYIRGEMILPTYPFTKT